MTSAFTVWVKKVSIRYTDQIAVVCRLSILIIID